MASQLGTGRNGPKALRFELRDLVSDSLVSTLADRDGSAGTKVALSDCVSPASIVAGDVANLGSGEGNTVTPLFLKRSQELLLGGLTGGSLAITVTLDDASTMTITRDAATLAARAVALGIDGDAATPGHGIELFGWAPSDPDTFTGRAVTGVSIEFVTFGCTGAAPAIGSRDLDPVVTTFELGIFDPVTGGGTFTSLLAFNNSASGTKAATGLASLLANVDCVLALKITLGTLDTYQDLVINIDGDHFRNAAALGGATGAEGAFPVYLDEGKTMTKIVDVHPELTGFIVEGISVNRSGNLWNTYTGPALTGAEIAYFTGDGFSQLVNMLAASGTVTNITPTFPTVDADSTLVFYFHLTFAPPPPLVWTEPVELTGKTTFSFIVSGNLDHDDGSAGYVAQARGYASLDGEAWYPIRTLQVVGDDTQTESLWLDIRPKASRAQAANVSMPGNCTATFALTLASNEGGHRFMRFLLASSGDGLTDAFLSCKVGMSS